MTTPNAHTSLLLENRPCKMASGEDHRIGTGWFLSPVSADRSHVRKQDVQDSVPPVYTRRCVYTREKCTVHLHMYYLKSHSSLFYVRQMYGVNVPKGVYNVHVKKNMKTMHMVAGMNPGLSLGTSTSNHSHIPYSHQPHRDCARHHDKLYKKWILLNPFSASCSKRLAKILAKYHSIWVMGFV